MQNSFHASPYRVASFQDRNQTRTFIASHSSLQHVPILVSKLMKQPHHSTRRSFCVSRSGERQKPRTNLPFLKISFPKFAWPLPYRLQEVQQVAQWSIACPASQWLEYSPPCHWTERQLTLDEVLTS